MRKSIRYLFMSLLCLVFLSGKSVFAAGSLSGENGSAYIGTTVETEKCDPKEDIMLNINIPFVGRCIKKSVAVDPVSDAQKNTTAGNAFPKLIGGLIRIVMTAVYIMGFLGILVGGFMIAASGADPSLKSKGKSLITGIIMGLILLGSIGIILNIINPDFFGVDS